MAMTESVCGDGPALGSAIEAPLLPPGRDLQGLGPDAKPGRRRRLWQLSPQAHELLLGMSFPPEVLRREAARQLGQMHRRRCTLDGSDADVLYAVVHDMARRNPLSEAIHKRLDEQHALAVRRLGALREIEALQAAWAGALDDDTVPAALWALLTHPFGESLETAALYDARSWVFAHGRRSVALRRSQQEAQARLLEDRRRADELQVRLDAQRRQSDLQHEQALAEIAQLRGELARLRSAGQQLTTPRASPVPLPRHAQAGLAVPPVTCPQAGAPLAQSIGMRRAPAMEGRSASAPSVEVLGRRVLCVGGIQHAVARYRDRVEQLGGRFEHHDGGLEDNVHALDARLGRADVVICQTGCINHEAYHRVKRHCDRTGTPCVYLDRPSLSRFDRALASPRGRSESRPGT